MNGLAVAVDSNLLLLLVVGMTSRDYIQKHKRLKAFTAEDFDLLQNELSVATEIVVTPNTLTETSNFVDHIRDPARAKIYGTLRAFVRSTSVTERYLASADVVENSELPRLGLADCVLLDACSSEITLITVDLQLYLSAHRRGEKVMNFNHVRNLL